MTKILKEQAENELKKNTKEVNIDDMKRILDKQEALEQKFKNNGPLERFVKDLVLLFSVIRNYVAGRYREIPWWSIAAIVASLLYVLNPIDLIPDFIPFFGYLDDALVLAACLSMVEQDLHKYEVWQKNNA